MYKKFIWIGFLLALFVNLWAEELPRQKDSGQTLELVVQIGHLGTVASVSFSPDGKYIVTGCGDILASWDINVKLWDVSTGREIRTFKGHSESVYSVSFSPDGKYIVTGSRDATAKLWEISTGREIRTFEGHSLDVYSVSFSPDGKYIVTGSWDKTAKLWDVVTGEEIRTFKGHLESVNSVSFSPDGKYIITGSGDCRPLVLEKSKDNTARLWEVLTGRLVRIFKGHRDVITSVSFSPDGRYIATGSWDETAKLWDVTTGKEIRTFKGHAYNVVNFVRSLSFSPDGRYIVTGRRAAAKLWEISTGREIRTFEGHSWSVYSVSFSPDGKYIATGGKDSTAKLWDADTGREIRTFEGHSNNVKSVSFSPNGRFIAFSTLGRYDDGTARLWDLATGREMRTFKGHSSFLNCVSFSPDGRYIATGSWDKTAKLWDVDTGREIRTFEGHSKWINSVSFSPDGRYIATGSGGDTAKLWDASTGREIRTYVGHSWGVKSVSFSPDGRYIATGSGDDTAKLWDVDTGRKIRTFEGHSKDVYSLSFSPDGRYIATGSWDETAKLWEVTTGKEIRTFKGHSKKVYSVSFSPDGRYIVTGSWDNTAKLWDVATGREVRTFNEHSGFVTSVNFSFDGKYIVTVSGDRTIKIWDINTGKEIATLVSVGEKDCAIFTPDFYYIASKDALKGIHFRIGNKVYPFEQFDLRLNRPDIVVSRLGKASPGLITAYKKAYQKRLHKMGFTEEQVQGDIHLPEVSLLIRDIPISTESKLFSFKVKAYDNKYYLDRFNIYVNDVPIYGIKGMPLKKKCIKSYEQVIELELSNGNNKIQVSCHNEHGTESLKETFEIVYSGEDTRTDLYVIAIGVSNYKDSEFNLNYAAKDAIDIAKLFQQNPEQIFDEVHTLLITDEEATKGSIAKARKFVENSRVDDNVVLFIAGHGLVDDDLNYYYGTYDVDFYSPSERGLPYEDLENILDGIPARKKLFIMDACHSGEIEKEEMQLVAAKSLSTGVKSRAVRGFVRIQKGLGLSLGNTSQFLQTLFADLRRGTGATIITSSSGEQLSFESANWRNGVFTYTFLEGMKEHKADKNNDGIVTVSEIRDYVIERVPELTGGRQTPTSRRENLEDDFRVW